MTAAGRGLPLGSTASHGTLLADAGRRVHQALTGAAVWAGVAVTEGDLPHGSRTSNDSLLANAGRREYQVHAGPTRGRCGVAMAAPEGGPPGGSGASVGIRIIGALEGGKHPRVVMFCTKIYITV